MADEHSISDRSVQQLAAGLQALYDASPADGQRLLAMLLDQAAAHPEAILRRVDSPSDVSGFNAGLIAIGGRPLGPGPPPPGGGGAGAFTTYHTYVLYPYGR